MSSELTHMHERMAQVRGRLAAAEAERDAALLNFQSTVVALTDLETERDALLAEIKALKEENEKLRRERDIAQFLLHDATHDGNTEGCVDCANLQEALANIAAAPTQGENE